MVGLAVLATTKIPNLKANHNKLLLLALSLICCISYYENTEFES